VRGVQGPDYRVNTSLENVAGKSFDKLRINKGQVMKTDFSKLPQVAPEYDLEPLLEMGAHFGHQTKRWHPSMAPFIYTQKNKVHIFDLAKTAEQLSLAYNYMYKLGTEGKEVIFVGTKRQAKGIVSKLAEENGVMYIIARWLGGFLTNWEQVSKSLQKMLRIEADQKEGKYALYTKYEQTQIEKDRARLERFFGGVRSLKKTPDALFIVDPKREDIAVEEASQTGVEVIALADSDANADQLTIAIPANDDSAQMVEFVVSEMIKAYTEGKKNKSTKSEIIKPKQTAKV